jgi:alkylation response protein AidB-like acyl-CoA dehydrogenase
VAATEAGSGSDVASMESTAEPTPDGLRITGEKRFVTWADRADVYLTLARNGVAGRGLTALLVPRATPGVRVEAPLQTAGLRGARLAPVSFEGCEVPPDAILGRAGAGGPVFQVAMTFERALVLAFRLGALDRALADAVTVARDRDAGGAPLARHQAVAHRIARMKLRLETSRLLIYRAAWALDQGHRAQAEAALAKWHVAESAIESALDALRLHGGAGFLEDSGLPAAVDDALGGSIHSGTSDVLATVVARWLGV